MVRLALKNIQEEFSDEGVESFSINFDLAKEILLNKIQELCLPSQLSDSKESIVTHWLADVNETPIGLTAKEKKYFLSILKSAFFIPKTAEIKVDFKDVPIPPPTDYNFKFIDLFAGIGGFRIGLQKNGGKCVFSSEWDSSAQKTYLLNYAEKPFGNIKDFTHESISDSEINKLIPSHEVLSAGFPCQPFSRAGVSARNSLGQKHGFECNIQGTLFFDLVRIIKVKRPKVLFLENVMALVNHDNGRTFSIIKETIEKELGYSFNYEIISSETLVPQRRKRCFIVCCSNGEKFDFPKFEGPSLALKTILEKKVDERFTISERLWNGHLERSKRNLDRGTGFTVSTADLNKPSNTIVARYGKDGKECLIEQNNKPPRMLTPRECARLQGFPEEFKLPLHKTPAYKQFGNAVTVSVVARIASRITEYL